MTRCRRSIVCLSGGMDSAVTAAIAAGESAELLALHVNYGQRTEQKELDCFHRLCDYFRVRDRLVADIGYLRAIGGSSLTDSRIAVEAADLGRETIPLSYVPFRNTHLLAIAASWGEVREADAIYIGAVAADSSGYPDCRPEFFRVFQELVGVGTRPETRLEIRTPVIAMSKAEIVRRGLELGAPLALTWSCYQAGALACGECDSCALRLRGFREAGVPDPIPYKKVAGIAG